MKEFFRKKFEKVFRNFFLPREKIFQKNSEVIELGSEDVLVLGIFPRERLTLGLVGNGVGYVVDHQSELTTSAPQEAGEATRSQLTLKGGFGYPQIQNVNGWQGNIHKKSLVIFG